MNNKSLVSIIVPVYNSLNYIEKCVRSITSQTYENIEIILVDDGSTDGSQEECDNLKKHDDRIKVIHQKNSGPSVARNKGLLNAKGKYIFFCDSDDYIDENVIEILVKNKKDNQLNGVYHYLESMNEKTLTKYEKKEYSQKDFLCNIFNGNILGTVWGVLFDKEITNNIRFDENTKCMEDTIFLIEYIKAAKINKIIYSDLAYYHYIINNASITQNKKNNLLKCKNYFYSLEKINKITKNEYEKVINDSKVKILEAELGNDEKRKYKLYFENLKISKYNGSSIRYQIFAKIYIKTNKKGLNIYYFFKDRLKHLLRR